MLFRSVEYRPHETGTDAAARAAGRTVSMHAELAGTDGLTVADMLADPQDRIAELIDAVEMQVAGAKVRELVAALPADQRETITRYYWGGQTGEQIAQAMGVDIKTVRRLQDKAMRRLRTAGRKIRKYLPPEWNVYRRGSVWTSPEEQYILMLEQRGAI